MTSHSSTRSGWRIATFALGVLAFFLTVAALFVCISDDFVIRGQVVLGTDPRVAAWRICLSLAGVLFAALAWLFYRQSRRGSGGL